MNLHCCFNHWQLIIGGILIFQLFGVIEATNLSSKPNEKPKRNHFLHDTELSIESIHNKKSNLRTCKIPFKESGGRIIRTHDSLDKGAKFLKATDASSAEQCKMQCCQDFSESCDLATFQEKQRNVDENQPRCFLFSCSDEKGNFVCVTSPNSDYMVLEKNREPLVADQLLDIAKESTQATESPTSYLSTVVTTSTSPETKATTAMESTTSTIASSATTTLTSTMVLTTSTPPETRSLTKTTTPTSSISSSLDCKKECERMEWQCDNGCCVKVTEVCNGKLECADNSDESQCSSLSDNAATTAAEKEQKHTDELNNSSLRVDTTIAEDTGNSKTKSAIEKEQEFFSEEINGQKSVLLPLVLGLAVTICILLMVICRLRVMRNKLKRRGKPLSMEESDYLINGMYL